MSEENTLEINWIIDRNPDYSLLFNYNDNNIIGNAINNAINNLTITSNYNLDHDIDDYIAFNSPFITHIEINIDSINLSNDDLNCCVCMETRESSQICQLNCCHKFCYECTLQHINKNRSTNCEPCCPLCRKNIKSVTVQNKITYLYFTL
jgi:hypothetical protein